MDEAKRATPARLPRWLPEFLPKACQASGLVLFVFGWVQPHGLWYNVEIKSFLDTSVLSEFHAALGQYLNCRAGLAAQDPERVLYLAVPEDIYRSFFQAPFGQFAIAHYQLKLLVYHVKRQEVVEWLH